MKNDNRPAKKKLRHLDLKSEQKYSYLTFTAVKVSKETKNNLNLKKLFNILTNGNHHLQMRIT